MSESAPQGRHIKTPEDQNAPELNGGGDPNKTQPSPNSETTQTRPQDTPEERQDDSADNEGHDRSRAEDRSDRGLFRRLGAKAAGHVIGGSVSKDLTFKPKTLVRQDKTKDILPKIPVTEPGFYGRDDRVKSFTDSLYDKENKKPTRDKRGIHDSLHAYFKKARETKTTGQEHTTPWVALLEDERRKKEGADYKGPDPRYHQMGSRVLRFADKRMGEGQTRSERLDNQRLAVEKDIYQNLTGLEVDSEGKINVPESITEKWASEVDERPSDLKSAADTWAQLLNPHNIHALKVELEKRWVAQGGDHPMKNRPEVIQNHMRSGNVKYLDVKAMAAYFGVSLEKWAKQINGESKAIPEDVINSLNHYISIGDETLAVTRCVVAKPTKEDETSQRLQMAGSPSREDEQKEILHVEDESEKFLAQMAEFELIDRKYQAIIDDLNARGVTRNQLQEESNKALDRAIKQYLGEDDDNKVRAIKRGYAQYKSRSKSRY